MSPSSAKTPARAQRFGELLDQDAAGVGDRRSTFRSGICIGGLCGTRRTTGIGRHGDEGTGDEPTDTRLRVPRRPSPSSSLALLGHHELFHRYEQRRRVKKVIASRPVDSFLDLKVGDYVVHVAHGIAKFTGMQTITKDGHERGISDAALCRERDAACAGGADQSDSEIRRRVSRASAALAARAAASWEKQKAKVAEAVMDMAAELLEIQAARAAEPGTGLSAGHGMAAGIRGGVSL